MVFKSHLTHLSVSKLKDFRKEVPLVSVHFCCISVFSPRLRHCGLLGLPGLLGGRAQRPPGPETAQRGAGRSRGVFLLRPPPRGFCLLVTRRRVGLLAV